MARGGRKRKGTPSSSSPTPSLKKGKQRSAPPSPELSDAESVSGDSYVSSTGTFTAMPTKKPAKIPPIFIETDKQPWHILAKDLFKNPGLEQVVAKTTTKQGQIIVNCPDEKSFRTVQSFLESKKGTVGYHTFSIPQDRPIKIAIKGLPLEVTDQELEAELKIRGFNPTSIRAFAKDGKRIPIHMVVLERETSTKDIFDISDLFYVKVKIEPYRQTGLPQCFNCQRFGHSSLRCGYSTRCVKCGEDHPTKACTKSKELPGKCCNCGENHTTNYRGCTSYSTAVAKTLVESARPQASKQTPIQPQPTEILPPPTAMTIQKTQPLQNQPLTTNKFQTSMRSYS